MVALTINIGLAMLTISDYFQSLIIIMALLMMSQTLNIIFKKSFVGGSKKIYDLNQQVQDQGGWNYATNDQRTEAMDLVGAEQQKYNAIKNQEYTPSGDVMNSIQTVLDKITGKYDRGGAP